MKKVAGRTSGIPTSGDSPSVLAALSSRQPSQFMRVYDRFARNAYSLALHLVGRAETAEAVTEEVFLALWRNPDEALTAPRGLDGYLADSVRRRAHRHLDNH